MTKQIRQYVASDGETYSVMQWPTNGPAASWYDVTDVNGSVINGEAFIESPTDADIEKLLASFKRTQL